MSCSQAYNEEKGGASSLGEPEYGHDPASGGIFSADYKRTMQKGSLSGRGRGPLSLHVPPQCTHINHHQSSCGSRGSLSTCRPSPLPLYEDLRRQRDALRAKLEEARHRFAAKTRELHEAARQNQQHLADSLRSRWEQRLFRELQQLKEETKKKREAEIRQLLRWKKAELCEAQKFLKQERDAAIRKARDFQLQLAKELASHGSGSRAAECHAKLEDVLGKLRWEFDGDQATQIRHLEAELELERRVFLKYVLERFEGEPLLAGTLPGFTGASLPPKGQVSSWGAAGECAQEASPEPLGLSIESYNQLEKQHTGLLNAVKVLVGRCIHLQEENALLRENSFPDARDGLASSPPEDKVNSWGAVGERTPEGLPQPDELSGQSYDQLVKQNEGLLNAVKVLVRRCIQLQEDNALLRNSSVPDTQAKPASSSPEDILSSWRVAGERTEPGALSEDSYNQLVKQNADLLKSLKILEEKNALQLAERQQQCEHLRQEVEEKHKRCEEAELKLREMLRENAKLSEERNSSVRLTQGLEAKVQNLEQLVKDMKERTERLKAENWGTAGVAQEGLPQPVKLPGNSHSQLTKQNADLLSSWKILEERCVHLEEDNALLREGSFPGLQDKVKILKAKGADLAAIAWRLQEAVQKLQEYHLRVPNTPLPQVSSDLVEEVSGDYLFGFIPSERRNEPSFSCQSTSCEENNSPDEERCDSLLSDGSGGTLCEVPGAVPYPQNLTLLILRSITTMSAEIRWFPSDGNYAHLVYLNEKKYDVTAVGVCCYAFQNLRPSTRYAVKVEPVVPQEISVFPQGGQKDKAREIMFTTLSDGPPYPPIDVQIPAGGSADFLIISWFPETVPPSASSNGVRVTGYAVYISGEKVAEIMSPTAGSSSSEASQKNTF